MKRLLALLFLIVSSSCMKLGDELSDNLVAVEVKFELNVSEELNVDVTSGVSQSDTKAIIDPEVGLASTVQEIIANYWVLQYNGVDDNAKLIGEAHYYDDMKSTIMLVASEKVNSVSQKNTVVILANTFENDMKFSVNSTLADLKSMLREVKDNESFLSSAGQDKYMVFCGMEQKVIDGETKLSFDLKRNVAKVNLSIVNSSEKNEVVIKSWQLRSVPSVSYYLTEYTLPEIFPEPNNFTGVDYPEVKVQLESGQSGSDVEYVPVNKWGLRSEVTNEAYKNIYAPEGATYLQVNAVDETGAPLIYKFYLGANMTSDFNLLPNTIYSYIFEIKSAGDAEFDSRVENDRLVDYANTNDEVANCYVINPSEGREFRIPVKRVDEFWGGRSGYEDVPENTLGANGEWKVEVLASYFRENPSGFTFKSSTGKGSYNANTSELSYFAFSVDPGTKGNVIVGLRKRIGNSDEYGPILWSWHLWITDYDPSEAYDHNAYSDIYSYDVAGGKVHRYKGYIWDSEYSKRFIMDRNLGAMDTGFPENSNEALYYQYGRKDPFFGFTQFSIKYIGDIHDDNNPVSSLHYAVQHPLDYIKSDGRGPWTKNNKYNPAVTDSDMRWLDPYTSKRAYPNTDKVKSIFDPCPPGYYVPKPEIWADFSNTTTNVGNSGATEGILPSFSSVKGVSYWPQQSVLISEAVYYPALGYMENFGVSQKENLVYQMSVALLGGWQLNGLKFGYEEGIPTVSPGYSLHQNLGMPVRCITSRDAE